MTLHRYPLGKYRISAGEYRVREYLILRSCGGWQLRDEHEGIVDQYPTLRTAMADALLFTNSDDFRKRSPAK